MPALFHWLKIPRRWLVRSRAIVHSGENMEDTPIWFKIGVWATVGATALYTVWGVAQMLMQP
jgi:hypothetical protein